jgi:FMN phosphatase YigB (HAD superfamily)
MKKQILFDFYRTLYDPKTEGLYSGVKKLLKILDENYDLFLISTGNDQRRNLIKKLEIDQYFIKVIICTEKKLDIFSQILNKNTLIIGDRYEEEIIIGKKLNAKIIQVFPEIENPVLKIRKELKI